jgi:hypothetical protein
VVEENGIRAAAAIINIVSPPATSTAITHVRRRMRKRTHSHTVWDAALCETRHGRRMAD